jgi:hypothetical protein
VIIQNRDGSIEKEPGQRRLFKNKRQGYYAAVPAHLLDDQSTLLDRLIGFAFDTLDAQRLEVRVYDASEGQLLLPNESCQGTLN